MLGVDRSFDRHCHGLTTKDSLPQNSDSVWNMGSSLWSRSVNAAAAIMSTTWLQDATPPVMLYSCMLTSLTNAAGPVALRMPRLKTQTVCHKQVY